MLSLLLLLVAWRRHFAFETSCCCSLGSLLIVATLPSPWACKRSALRCSRCLWANQNWSFELCWLHHGQREISSPAQQEHGHSLSHSPYRWEVHTAGNDHSLILPESTLLRSTFQTRQNNFNYTSHIAVIYTLYKNMRILNTVSFLSFLLLLEKLVLSVQALPTVCV